MHRFSVCFFGLMAAAVVVGCGPGKELPTQISIHKETQNTKADPGGTIPETSEPEAKAFADKTIKAITQGNPAAADKAIICRMAARGKFKHIARPEMIEAVRTIFSVFPDRARVSYEFTELPLPKSTFGLHSPDGWVTPAPEALILPSELGKVILADLTAQHWIPLALGLKDRTAVFFGAQNEKAGAGGVYKFKVGYTGVMERPVYIVSCDQETGLPSAIDYSPLQVDQRSRDHKVFSFSDYRAFQGLMLPYIMKSTLKNGKDLEVENWIVGDWEFPDKFDATQFEKPK